MVVKNYYLTERRNATEFIIYFAAFSFEIMAGKQIGNLVPPIWNERSARAFVRA